MISGGLLFAALKIAVRQAEVGSIVAAGFKRAVLEGQQLYQSPSVYERKIRTVFGGKNGRIGDPDLVDAGKIGKADAEFYDLPVDFAVPKCDLVALQKQDALVGGGGHQLGNFG